MTDQPNIIAEQNIRRWIEATMGDIVAIDILPGWRPAWNASVRTPEGVIHIHIRGDRGAGQETQPLRVEHDVLRLLADEGIAVPHIHGWCDRPAAIAMERIDATAFAGGADRDAKLHRLVGDYMAIMASVHRIDVAKAVGIGLLQPQGPQSTALAYFSDADQQYQRHRDGPDPLIAFLRKWVLGHLPLHRTETALLIADAPQFFHDGERITHIYDLELAHLGDPMADLASIRVRDINEPIGDLTQLLKRYVAESGKAIDWGALDFHTIVAFLAVPMRMKSALRTQHQLPAYVEYLSWDLGCRRAALEILAQVRGVDLAPVGDLVPVEKPTAIIYDNLVASCIDLPAASGRLREPPALSLARYLQRRDAIGDEVVRRDQSEAEQLLGRCFPSAAGVEVALEQFVLDAGPDNDSDLIGLFHRRTMRALQLLRGYPGPIVDRAPSPIDRLAFSDPPSTTVMAHDSATHI
ncbi:phosphotransferase (plasmid) [Sphingomonas bisphenolicum]